ncbi:MAG TPA: hypothetical protein VI357_09380 [Mycobacteriales bacterium]
MATDSGKDERDSDAELAAAVYRVLALLTDLRRDAQTPELSERINLVQWLRRELGDVEDLLARADARRHQDPAAPAASAVR